MKICSILLHPKSLLRYIYILYYRYFFFFKKVQYGDNLKIYNRIQLKIGKNANIKIGKSFTFTSGGFYNPICRNILGIICLRDNASLSIGDNVGISSSCIWSHGNISIGNNVLIGGDCLLIDSDCHSLNYLDRRIGYVDIQNKIDKDIVIEDDVLIGARSIILKGVRIGARSVIGAGSIVVNDIPPDCIAAGNPCVVKKIIK